MVDGTLTILEHPTEVWVRHGYNPSESPQCVSFFKKKGVQALEQMPPPELWEELLVSLLWNNGHISSCVNR